MVDKVLTVVVSQGQSRNPEKRLLEQQLAEAASQLPGVEVLVVPHLYDLQFDGETIKQLKNTSSDLVVFSWLYERAAHWVLDRQGVRGQEGVVELKRLDEDEDDQDDQDEGQAEQEKLRVATAQPRPSRFIYCVDLRVNEDSAAYVAELQRIHKEVLGRFASNNSVLSQIVGLKDWINGQPSVESLARYYEPTNNTSMTSTENARIDIQQLFGIRPIRQVDEHPTRRWYPVIDFSRCTNCMECIDFCLFGVYGVDSVETIVVEQPDNCRKGCPACSRVCPENAIIFPQHKTPAIAGAPMDAGGLKIDLSKLFGAPESDEDAIAVAARERDEQLLLAGREAVGESVGVRHRTSANTNQPKDELDSLLDQLDSLDL